MILQYFSSAHTVDLNKSNNHYNDFLSFSDKDYNEISTFFCSADNADLNKRDNTYNLFVVFSTAKELARASKS